MPWQMVELLASRRRRAYGCPRPTGAATAEYLLKPVGCSGSGVSPRRRPARRGGCSRLPRGHVLHEAHPLNILRYPPSCVEGVFSDVRIARSSTYECPAIGSGLCSSLRAFSWREKGLLLS